MDLLVPAYHDDYIPYLLNELTDSAFFSYRFLPGKLTSQHTRTHIGH